MWVITGERILKKIKHIHIIYIKHPSVLKCTVGAQKKKGKSNMKSSLANKISIPLIPADQKGEEENDHLGGKGAFTHPENYISKADIYQLTLTM